MDRAEINSIVDQVDRLLVSEALFCRDVEICDRGETMRIYLEEGSGPVVFSDCKKASRILQDDQSFSDAYFTNYCVELSSPGVDKPLRTLAHFEAAVGESVKLRFSSANGNKKTVSGKLCSAEAGSLCLEDDNMQRMVVDFESLIKANVIFNWN